MPLDAAQDVADLLTLLDANLDDDEEEDDVAVHTFILGLTLAVRYPGYARELSAALTPTVQESSPAAQIIDHFIEHHAGGASYARDDG